MSEPETHEGGCLCGAVRYRVAGPLGDAVYCHCALCRRANAAPAVPWITVPPARFALTAGAPASYRSSDHGTRAFCAACGTQLTFRTTQRPDDVDVTLCSLDRPQDATPAYHIWSESRLPWLRLDEHLPAHAGASPADGQD